MTVKETQEVDIEAPPQLGNGETVDSSSRGDVSELYVETETTLDQPNVISSANVPLQKSPASLKTVSKSSDEDDNIPIHETIRKNANVIPVTIRMLSYREACETAEFGELLGHEVATTLHRKQGWLKELLLAEGDKMALNCNQIISFYHNTFLHQGILEDKPDALKLRVGYDYTNQLAFIEGMLPPNRSICYASPRVIEQPPPFWDYRNASSCWA